MVALIISSDGTGVNIQDQANAHELGQFKVGATDSRVELFMQTPKVFHGFGGC